MASALIGAGISGIGSLIGSGKQASAIKSAAQTQATAADYAANLSAQATSNSLDFAKGVYSDTTRNAQPYQAAGGQALSTLSDGLQTGGEFNSTPTSDQILADDPGYAFRMQQGQLAMARAESASGGVGSGGALKAAAQYGQDYASGEFGNAYQRYMTTRQANYSNLANMITTGLSGTQLQSNSGAGTASNVSNTSLSGANAEGNYVTQGANATAAGAVGTSNVQASNLSSLGTTLQQLLAKFGASSGTPANPNGTGYAVPGVAQTTGGLSLSQLGGMMGNLGVQDTSGDVGNTYDG